MEFSDLDNTNEELGFVFIPKLNHPIKCYFWSFHQKINLKIKIFIKYDSNW
jgi:hypothetical protein